MDDEDAGGHAACVSRVVITGVRPQHLSRAEARVWMHSELAKFAALPGVESVFLSCAQASDRHPRQWAWLCELQLAEGVDGHACADHPLCTEWLMDLRLLGMRPALAVLDDGEQVH